MQHIIHNFKIFLINLRIIPFFRFNANYQRAKESHENPKPIEELYNKDFHNWANKTKDSIKSDVDSLPPEGGSSSLRLEAD
jgi:hypothetical protein